MNKKSVIILAVALVLLAIIMIRSCFMGGAEPQVETKRYMECTACGARYEIPRDFMLNFSADDIKLLPDGNKLFRCEECGEVAALPKMTVIVDGKEVEEDIGYEE